MSDAQTNLEIYLPYKPEKLFVRKNQDDKKGIFYIREDIVDKEKQKIISYREDELYYARLDATKNIQAVYEKYNGVKMFGTDQRIIYMLEMEKAIKADGLNAGWIKGEK